MVLINCWRHWGPGLKPDARSDGVGMGDAAPYAGVTRPGAEPDATAPARQRPNAWRFMDAAVTKFLRPAQSCS